MSQRTCSTLAVEGPRLSKHFIAYEGLNIVRVFKSLLVLTVLFLGSFSPAHAVPLVTNGGFDTFVNPQTPTGWCFTPACSGSLACEDACFGNPPPSYEFGGTTVNSFDVISQNIATTAGQSFIFNWQISGSGDANSKFEALVNGSQVFTQLSPATGGVFATESVIFVAAGATTTIGLGGFDNPSFFQVDNVAVNAAAPELNPSGSTVPLMMAACVLLLLADRRVKKPAT